MTISTTRYDTKGPIMNEEFELNDIDYEPIEDYDEPSNEPSGEPEFATKDDLRAFARELMAELRGGDDTENDEVEYDDPLRGYDPEFASDMRRVLDEQARAIHAEYAPILSTSIASEAAQMVAGDMGREAQRYIGSVISLMDPMAAKAMLNDPAGVEMLPATGTGSGRCHDCGRCGCRTNNHRRMQ